jgi:3-oxoacyl-[acyl-carrier protein] reductase
MNLDLRGKTAWISGSTQGIGKATAIELANMGARCILIARNEVKLKAVCEELHKINGANHSYVVADFSKPESLNEALTSAIKSHNEAHILVNNTGGPAGGKAIDADLNAFRATFEAHLVCNHILVQALVPLMKKAAYGRIINVISTSVKAPLANLGVSNTIRGAVANWSKTLANELGEFNITVNNVLPGATRTARLEGLAADKSEKTGESIDSIIDNMGMATPMKRVAEPEEVANAIAFLASPAASYINGINIPVDGGRTPCL